MSTWGSSIVGSPGVALAHLADLRDRVGGQFGEVGQGAGYDCAHLASALFRSRMAEVRATVGDGGYRPAKRKNDVKRY